MQLANSSKITIRNYTKRDDCMVVRLIGLLNEEQTIVRIYRTKLDLKKQSIVLCGIDGTKYVIKSGSNNIQKEYDRIVEDLFVSRKTMIACEKFEEIKPEMKKEELKYFHIENGEYIENDG